jgi:hypothetical protein
MTLEDLYYAMLDAGCTTGECFLTLTGADNPFYGYVAITPSSSNPSTY